MKEKLQCDNCGGNLIQTESGLYSCPHCGTGYKITGSSQRNPQLDNTIIDNGLSPDRLMKLSSEFKSFCFERGIYQ